MTDTSEKTSRSWLDKLSHLFSHEPKNRKQLMEVIRDAEERDILSAEISNMVESVIHVSEMRVREIMIPRSQIIVVEHDMKLATILPILIQSAHSRFPVLDADEDIIGILLAKDLLKFYFEGETENFRIEDVMRPAFFVPQSKRLDILLREFRSNRNHMAIVLNEYGHVAGLITIEDVLEQIVGEIEDEYDIDEEENIKAHSDKNWTVKASTPIEEFNEQFNTELSDVEFDTIGGIILKGFGHLPKRGETITLENYKFKVLHSDNRRLYLLEVTKLS